MPHARDKRSLSLSLFLSAGLRGHSVTLRPSARPTTPCFFGVAGFGVPADRGTELQSWLSPSELASPSLYASEPQQASSPRPLTSLHTHGTKAACLVHAPLPKQVHQYVLPWRQFVFSPVQGVLQNRQSCGGGGVQVSYVKDEYAAFRSGRVPPPLPVRLLW